MCLPDPFRLWSFTWVSLGVLRAYEEAFGKNRGKMPLLRIVRVKRWLSELGNSPNEEESLSFGQVRLCSELKSAFSFITVFEQS